MVAYKSSPYHVGPPPQKASQKKCKRQGVQFEDEEGECKPSGPFIEVSTLLRLPTSTEKRPVKALKSRSKLKTSSARSSKRGKEVPPSDDEQRWKPKIRRRMTTGRPVRPN